MSGRHRKPTTSSLSVAKIAVTGAVLSGGTIGLAAQAQAASDSEWDVVASCESSGNWAINTGNGYQGGLQFSPSTWLGYGGGQFASAANLASRDQQIAIAEKVLAGQGRGAWPVCGRGLSGPTPRDVSIKAAKPATSTPPAAASTKTQPPATVTPLDAPVPDAPPVAQDTPAVSPAPEAPADPASPAAPAAPAPAPAPSPENGPQDLPAQDAPQPQIISISQIETDPEPTIVEADTFVASDGVPHLSRPAGEVTLSPGPVDAPVSI